MPSYDDHPDHAADPAFERAIKAALTQRTPAPFRCPDLITLAAWIDGNLTGAACDAVDRHLADCPTCTNAVADARAVIADQSGAMASPLEVERVTAALDPWRTRVRHPAVVVKHRWRYVAAAAAITVACWTGFQLGRHAEPVERVEPVDARSAMTFDLLEDHGDHDALLTFVMQLTEDAR